MIITKSIDEWEKVLYCVTVTPTVDEKWRWGLTQVNADDTEKCTLCAGIAESAPAAYGMAHEAFQKFVEEKR